MRSLGSSLGGEREVVLRKGFEPSIFAVRGRCPKPLDDRSNRDPFIPDFSNRCKTSSPRLGNCLMALEWSMEVGAWM